MRLSYFLRLLKQVEPLLIFPKPVTIDLGTLDIGLVFFGDVWLDFTKGADFSGATICLDIEKGDTSGFYGDGGSRLAFAVFDHFGADWVS